MSARPLRFTVGTSYGTPEELLALLSAIIGATPSSEERLDALYNALAECCDELLKDLTAKELEYVLSGYMPPPGAAPRPPRRRKGAGR
jgi:hypothetical protein